LPDIQDHEELIAGACVPGGIHALLTSEGNPRWMRACAGKAEMREALKMYSD
jgi:hypothetical protein